MALVVFVADGVQWIFPEIQVGMAFETYHRELPVIPVKARVKSPGRVSRDARKANHGSRPSRQDFSRARTRAIEASLDPDEPWEPTSDPHIKTPEEEVIWSIYTFHLLANSSTSACPYYGSFSH
jgi:hypothetical protein